MSNVSIDTARWPLVVVSFKSAPTDAELRQGLDAMAEHLKRGPRCAHVLDLSGQAMPPASQQQLLREWFATNAAAVKAASAGAALVFPSILTQGLVRAFLTAHPAPCPVFVCGRRADAEKWAAGKLNA
jgi:hypothetical protein